MGRCLIKLSLINSETSKILILGEPTANGVFITVLSGVADGSRFRLTTRCIRSRSVKSPTGSQCLTTTTGPNFMKTHPLDCQRQTGLMVRLYHISSFANQDFWNFGLSLILSNCLVCSFFLVFTMLLLPLMYPKKTFPVATSLQPGGDRAFVCMEFVIFVKRRITQRVNIFGMFQ